jgi:hypothetical protein
MLKTVTVLSMNSRTAERLSIVNRISSRNHSRSYASLKKIDLVPISAETVMNSERASIAMACGHRENIHSVTFS